MTALEKLELTMRELNADIQAWPDPKDGRMYVSVWRGGHAYSVHSGENLEEAIVACLADIGRLGG